MRGKRATDSWEAIKWIPRFLLFAMSFILILYIFAVAISVEYDASGLKADTMLGAFIYSDVFSSPSHTGVIALERFSTRHIGEAYGEREEDEPDLDTENPIVEVLVFAPVAARFELMSLDGSFETREIFFEEPTFLRLRELYIAGDRRGSIRLASAQSLVRVVNESDPQRIMPARLTVQVIV